MECIQFITRAPREVVNLESRGCALFIDSQPSSEFFRDDGVDSAPHQEEATPLAG